MQLPIRAAFGCTGSGSNFGEAANSALVEGGKLNGFILPSLMIASHENIGAIRRAENFNIPWVLIDYSKGREQAASSILQALEYHKIELFVLAGWTKIIPGSLIDKFKGEIINLHPTALDQGFTDFGGRGMYDLATHLTVVTYAAVTGLIRTTESTIHKVTEKIDDGKTISRTEIEIPFQIPRMSFNEAISQPELMLGLAKQLQDYFLPFERTHLVDTLHGIAISGITTMERNIRLIPDQHIQLVTDIKTWASDIIHPKKRNPA